MPLTPATSRLFLKSAQVTYLPLCDGVSFFGQTPSLPKSLGLIRFPLTEIKRALNRFGRRPDLAGLTPAVVKLHPAHEALVQPETVVEFGLEMQFNEKIGVGYIWLTGSPPDPDGRPLCWEV